MKFSNLLKIFLFLCSFGMLSATQQTSGCNRGKSEGYGPPQPATDSRSADYLMKRMKKQETDIHAINALTAKARIVSENDDMTLAANANIIWIRDSIVWVNAKKFGIEAIRALITRDSVFVLNRLEKTCTSESLESLRVRFNLPEGDVFTVLQNTILGLGVFPDTRQIKSDIKDEKHRLLTENNQFTAEYYIEEGSFLLKNEVFLQKKDNAAIDLIFGRHQKIKESPVPFSYARHVETFSPESGRQKIDIEMDEILFNTHPSYKFDIPDHYSRR